MGFVHLKAGARGLFILMLTAGLGCFLVSVMAGRRKASRTEKAVAWFCGLIVGRDIAWGFSMRPQIMTALALVALIFLIRLLIRQKWRALIFVPLLFIFWVNAHGGALLGVILVLVAFFAQAGWRFLRKSDFVKRFAIDDVDPKMLPVFFVTGVLALLSIFVNPYGTGLPKWLVESVSYVRPEIEEWNSAVIGTSHLGFAAAVVAYIAAMFFGRKKIRIEESAICAVLAVAGMRHERHIPLFCIAFLICMPARISDCIERLKAHSQNLIETCRKPRTRNSFIAVCLLSASWLLFTLFTSPSVSMTMQIPADEYPVDAVKFIKANNLKGNMIVYFDWGQMVIWELPDCPPSFDGRLDTCYPRDVIETHWDIYKGVSLPQGDPFDINKAELALLPVWSASAVKLQTQFKWTEVYRDQLAVVLVRDPEKQELPDNFKPVDISAFNTERVPFPSTPSSNAVP